MAKFKAPKSGSNKASASPRVLRGPALVSIVVICSIIVISLVIYILYKKRQQIRDISKNPKSLFDRERGSAL